MKNKGKIHYAWFILAACCLLQTAILGIVQNCRGIFYDPVCSDLGLETSAFTLYSLFHGAASFLSMPLTTRFLDRVHPRIALFVTLTLFCGSTALMGSVSTLPAFYTLGALQGVGGSLLIFYVCPFLINNWFDKRYGFAMGFYTAFSGLAGVVVNPLLNAVIEKSGWRTGFHVQGLMAFAVALPAVLIIRSTKPETVGLARYGESGRSARTDPAAETAPASPREKQLLVLAMVFTALVSLINAYAQHLAKYALSIGLTAAVGAMLMSLSMAGNIASKFVTGFLNDRIGAKKTLYVSTGSLVLAFSLILVTAPAVLYPAAVVSGNCMTICALGVPMFAKYLYGPYRYRKFYRIITMITTLVSSAGITLVSLMAEGFGSYTPVMLIASGMAVLAAGLVFLASKLLQKPEKDPA